MAPIIRASIVAVIVICVKLWHSCAASAESQRSWDKKYAENASSAFLPQFGGCDRVVLENGEVDESGENFTVGERLQIRCQEGFRFQYLKSRSLIIVCMTDGTWKEAMELNDIPKCERIGGCPLPPTIKNGYVGSKAGGFMPGDAAPVTCEMGFSLYPHNAKPLFVCTSDGQWRPMDNTELTCKANEDCPWPSPVANGSVQVFSPDGAIISANMAKYGYRAIYHCALGFLLTNGTASLTCVDGAWQGILPTCRPKQTTDRCSRPPIVSHADLYHEGGSKVEDTETDFAHGKKIVYICDYGFYQQGSSLLTCITGEWIGQGPKCLPEERSCSSLPPELTHGDFSLHGKEAFGDDRYPPGSRAFYFCNNGYRLRDINLSLLTCTDGMWTGNLTSCIQRTNCDPPMDIENGNWIIESLYTDFRIGVSVSYECDEGYKAVGATEIKCQFPGYWSDYGPRCLPLDLYCAEPEPPTNGFFMCKPSHCDFFRVGTEVHHICNKNFEPHPSSALIQTCLPGGTWSGRKPVCLSANMVTPNAYSLNANSLTVVVSTACGVFGLLVSVMAVVIIKRRQKARGRLCPPTPGPPSRGDYSNHHPDDQDCEALIPQVDFSPSGTPPIAPTLPTYEEAMTIQRAPSRSPGGTSWASFARPNYRDCRSLPGSRMIGAVVPFGRDQASLESSQHRNSITTMASGMTRADNGSMVYGSIETVNVSDATSTSVTVDTCDSMASNPSIAMSHRAAAGSIDSSFANEVPPCDSGVHMADRRDHEGVSCASVESNRSHNESTPILEVPEDGKEEYD